MSRNKTSAGAARRPQARLGVDIGGTFTDVALEIGTTPYTAKTLTTHDAPERGVLTGMREVVAKAGIRPQDVWAEMDRRERLLGLANDVYAQVG